MNEYTAVSVTLEVLAHLERRRPAIASDPALVREEVAEALLPVASSYKALGLPPSYLEALQREIMAAVPERWREVALRFAEAEKRSFGVWRGGDPISRLTYVLAGLAVGGFVVWAPFIPIWEKWLPFAMAAGGWWLPDLQTAWHRRRYARALGEIARQMEGAQKQLDRAVTLEDMALPPPASRGTP